MHENYIDLYKQMKFIRVVENAIAREYPSQEMRCPIHLSVGQEAIAVGVCHQLNKEDKVFSNHRCHAHYLAKGGSLYKMLAELYGKSDGCCGGRGGSMHLFDDDVGLKASIPIVGSGIPLAVGAALADKLSKDKLGSLSVVFFGDGAIEEGAFYECANFASLMALPVLFVCENNMFSCYTHISQRQPPRDLEKLAQAHLIKTFHANGNELISVVEVSKQAIDYIRNHQKPAFIQFDTYRHLEHCGIASDDHLNYRDANEVDNWLASDPVLSFEKYLLEIEAADENLLSQIEKDLENKVNLDISKAKNACFPDPLSIADHVYK